MKKSTLIIAAVGLFVLLAMSLPAMAGSEATAAGTQLLAKADLKPGAEVFACACGAACPCQTISATAGKCTCGKEMVKVKVKSVSEGKAILLFNGEEREFKTSG